MYLKNKAGNHIRIDNADVLGVASDNGTWRIFKNGQTDPNYSAGYSSQQAAEDALDEILGVLGKFKDPA